MGENMNKSFEENYRKGVEKLVESIKMCGQSIIDNADRIAGGYKLQGAEVVITISISTYGDRAPNITATQEFLPEKIIEKIS